MISNQFYMPLSPVVVLPLSKCVLPRVRFTSVGSEVIQFFVETGIARRSAFKNMEL